MSLTSKLRVVLVPAALILPLTLSCTVRPLERPISSTTDEIVGYFPQTIEKDVDILFMIDDSLSMEEEQQNLKRNFARFIEGLRFPKLGALPGKTCTAADPSGCKIPNVRIGVVSSDLGAGPFTPEGCGRQGGDGGLLQSKPGKLAAPGCAAPSGAWIEYGEDSQGRIVTNVLGASSSDPVEQVKEAFSCIAPLGASGCGFEHQLESVKRALEGCQYANGAACTTNPGFLRKDAYLAIVWLTDEDDCSARRTELFDPSQQGIDDPLGPLKSFRCTEFGLVCAENLRQPGVKHDCVPGLDYLYPVDGYAEFFRGLKPPGRVMLFAIAAPTGPVEVGLESDAPVLKPTCSSVNGHGDPAIRLASVVKSFGPQGHFNEGVEGGQKVELNICSSDFSPALRLFGASIIAELGAQCISSPVRTTDGKLACRAGDPVAPGVSCAAGSLDHADCLVEERQGGGDPSAIPRCPSELFDPTVEQGACGASCPCWRVVPSKDCDPKVDGSPYALQIMRAGEASRGAVAEVRCAAVPFAWGSPELGEMAQP